MTKNYSEIKSLVLEIERLQDILSKTAVCPVPELLEFLTQEPSDSFEGLMRHSDVLPEEASTAFIAAITRLIENEIEERMKKLDAINDIGG